MKRQPDATPPRDYHLRLGVPRPDLSLLAGRRNLKLLDLLVAALLERGGPMAPEEVAERLEAVGVGAATGDLPLSLKRAAAPSPNVFRDEAGRFALDLADPQDPDLGYRPSLRRAPPPPQARVELTLEERDLVLAHCTALDPAIEHRLGLAPVEGRNGGAVLTVTLALDDLGIFIGDVAFAANHTENLSLERRLSRLCEKLEEAERRGGS